MAKAKQYSIDLPPDRMETLERNRKIRKSKSRAPYLNTRSKLLAHIIENSGEIDKTED